MYDSWVSRMRLYSKGKKHGRMMINSIDNVPLVYPTVVDENSKTRPKTYSELTEAEQLQDDYDVQATNIILHGLSPDVFSQLINDMHTIGMTMQQVQVNIKFLNALPPDWIRIMRERYPDPLALVANSQTLYNPSQYPQHSLPLLNQSSQQSTPTYAAPHHHQQYHTPVNLLPPSAKSLYTTNYDQLYAYLSQHKCHANKVRIMRERYPDPLALVANSQNLYNPSQYPQHSLPLLNQTSQQSTPTYAAPLHRQQYHTLDVPTFQQGKDLIDCINKAMSFLSAVASRFPSTNNQLRTSSNPRNQATIQDGEMLQPQGEIMQLVRQRWLNVKTVKTKTPQNVAFQTEDLDVYDSDCDDVSSAKAVWMANLSRCDSDVLSEVPYSDIYQDAMINQSVQKMQCSEETHN
ncbi:hypothetical protein Tco_1219223 [Tanacetum coccineum]